MKRGIDVAVRFPGLYLVHHNLPEQDVEEHVHESEHQLILVLQGEICVRLPDRAAKTSVSSAAKLNAGAGRGIYLPPGCPHAFASTNAQQGERLIAHVSDALWKKVGGAALAPAVFPSPSLCQELLFFLLLHKETPYAEGLAGATVLALCESIRARGGGPGPVRSTGGADPEAEFGAWREHLLSSVADDRVRKAVAFVFERATEDIPLAAIAKASGLSERNLSRLFAAESGFSPKQLQTRVRMETAKALLSKPRTSVTEAAFAVGYSSVSLFIEAFRNVTGKVPSLWRETEGLWR